MKVLVVGGTGLIGGHAALYLRSLGHDVSICARKPPPGTSELSKLPFIQGDYIAGTFIKPQLAPFEAVVFSAGNDMRHVPDGTGYDEHCLRANGEAVPAFGELARAAGVKRFVHIGSFYPHIAPELIASNAYIRSRKLATERLFALAAPDFRVVSLDAPFVVGTVPGLSNPMFEAYTQYAENKKPIPPFGPAGGTNFISAQSLSEAIAGALVRGESGKAYLVGDENLTFARYFELFFRAAGNTQAVPSLDQEHPLLPDAAILTGRGYVASYEPDAAETAQLGYRRNDIQRAVSEVVAQFTSAS